MKKLVERELSKKTNKYYRILELGSWAGSSAVLWASACKKFDKGMVYCLDNWKAAPNAPVEMLEAVKNNNIFKLFFHNIETSGLKRYCQFLVGSSNELGPILGTNVFDLVYIDGDHAYKQFKQDLINYSKMLKIGGVICGDDLELQLSEVESEIVNENLENDFV